MIIREKVTLRDGEAAMRITGIAQDYINLRVRRTGLETKQNGVLQDTIIRAVAYVVDDDGKSTAGETSVGPEVTVNVHGSAVDLTRAAMTLSNLAQTAYISFYNSRMSVQNLPMSLPI